MFQYNVFQYGGIARYERAVEESRLMSAMLVWQVLSFS